MRRCINVSKDEQKKLEALFPEILAIDSGDDALPYKKFAISVFDHWLTRGEAKPLLENVSDIEAIKRNNIHMNFNKFLCRKTNCLTYKIKGRGNKIRPVFKRFLHEESLYNYIKPQSGCVSSRFLFRLVLPELSALYYEGWDNTNYIYFRDEKWVDMFLDWAKTSDLYILQCT